MKSDKKAEKIMWHIGTKMCDTCVSYSQLDFMYIPWLAGVYDVHYPAADASAEL